MRTTPGIVALCLLVPAALGVAACGRPPASKGRATPTTIEALTPRGAASPPFVFSWATSAGEDRLRRVSVCDMAERLLFEHDTTTDRVEAPADLQRMLPPGTEFQWKVAVIDDAGTVLAESPMVRVTVK